MKSASPLLPLAPLDDVEEDEEEEERVADDDDDDDCVVVVPAAPSSSCEEMALNLGWLGTAEAGTRWNDDDDPAEADTASAAAVLASSRENFLVLLKPLLDV